MFNLAHWFVGSACLLFSFITIFLAGDLVRTKKYILINIFKKHYQKVYI